MKTDPTKPVAAASTSTPIPMIVCPTSHNDWDWEQTFECYYAQAFTGCGVKGIWDAVVSIFNGTSAQDLEFCWSYAEVGFLRRYLTDNEASGQTELILQILINAGARFCLLGGGITSPDNQVCNGEVYIRNYLTGHAYLKKVGLIGQVFPVSWIPDDFGHDPQLPVLLEAMGMKAAGLSRVPGSPQPSLCPNPTLADATLRADGVTFNWTARDNSAVLTQFMPQTYYGITNYSLSDTTQAIRSFLNDHGSDVWPGNLIFATQGGDWQFPLDDSTPCGSDTSAGYNWQEAINNTVSNSQGTLTVTANLGTFADYFNGLQTDSGTVQSQTLWAENFYTGYFASRPQLKIDHYYAARQLLAAETLASLQLLYSTGDGTNLQALQLAIDEAWELLVPSSHHDFVTGTSPDSTYQSGGSCGTNPPLQWDQQGQLAMSQHIVELADRALNLAMELLAGQLPNQAPHGWVPVVVFNPLGMALPDTAIVELADPSQGGSDYQVWIDGLIGPVQRSSDGTLLFQVPGFLSMSYKTVFLIPLSLTPADPAQCNIQTDYQLDNGSVCLTLSYGHAWAISSLMIGDGEFIPSGEYANNIEIWDDSGNIYQFGMEYIDSSGCGTGTFAPSSDTLTATDGCLLENGPVRWRFKGNMSSQSGNTFSTLYDLVAGETLVRITTEGTAPSTSSNSVLTSFPIQTPLGLRGNVLEYGTSYHWENRDPHTFWPGLNFRASHNFAMLASGEAGQDNVIPVAGVYHDGIPAWTIDDKVLRGCLLRNTPNGNRAANGSDTDPHIQHYSLDVGPQLQSAVTGYPLRTALYAHTKIHAQALNNAIPFVGTMPKQAQLAGLMQSNAVIRVAKPSEERCQTTRNIVLRLQQATNGTQPLQVQIPYLNTHSLADAKIVTALENNADNAPPVTNSGDTLSFLANRALWSLAVSFAAS